MYSNGVIEPRDPPPPQRYAVMGVIKFRYLWVSNLNKELQTHSHQLNSFLMGATKYYSLIQVFYFFSGFILVFVHKM